MRRSRLVLGAAAFAALQCVAATAGASALGSFLRSDYQNAYAQYQALAAQGSSNAQTMVGAMSQDGIGTDVSVEEATAAFEKAATAGNSVAQNGLGYMYDKGRGVGIDFPRAFSLYQAAAQKGFPRAEFNLGVMYDLGQGVSRDRAQAFKWYLSAAQNGQVSAQNSVGGMYALGQGVEKNAEQAVHWFHLAASSGRDVRALGNLGVMYALGSGVEKDSQRALGFYQKASAAKDANADFNLGLLYLKGDGVPKDLSRAVSLFQQAASRESERARAVMGLMYATGFGVDKVNAMRAVTLLLTAANKADQDESRVCHIKTAEDFAGRLKKAQEGNAPAQYCVGVLYLQGLPEVVAADPEQANQWLQASAQQGDPGAQYRVGLALMQKAANPWESQDAIHWFLASALRQRPEAVPGTAAGAQRFLEESKPSIAYSLVTTPTSVSDLVPGQLLAAVGDSLQLGTAGAPAKAAAGAAKAQ